MTTLHELRTSLERHADLAPDGFGLVEQARAGAKRIRRRRRIIVAGVAAAAVLVVGGAPAVVRLRQPAPQVAAPADTRTSIQRTLDVVAGSGVTLGPVQAHDTRQTATAVVRTMSSNGTEPPLAVTVYDPGAFDPAILRRGTPVTVRGMPAWLHADYPEGPLPYAPPPFDNLGTTVLGWQDPSGAWVLVSPPGSHSPIGSVDERTTLRMNIVAHALRLGPVRDIAMPYRIGWLPPGVHVQAVQADPAGTEIRTNVQLSDVRSTPARSDRLTVTKVQVSIDTSPRTGSWPQRRDAVSRTRTTVAGHPARYRPTEGAAAPSTLAVEIGTCGFMIKVWRHGISLAQQERIVAGLTVADCGDPGTWGPVR